MRNQYFFLFTLLTNITFAQNKFVDEIEDIVFSGVSEKFTLLDDFGDAILIDGNEVSVPKHSVKLILKDNNKLLLKVIGDNRNNTFEGDYILIEENEDKIKIESIIIQSNLYADSIDINHPLYKPENNLELEITPKNFKLELSFNSLPSIILGSTDPKVKAIKEELNRVKGRFERKEQ